MLAKAYIKTKIELSQYVKTFGDCESQEFRAFRNPVVHFAKRAALCCVEVVALLSVEWPGWNPEPERDLEFPRLKEVPFPCALPLLLCEAFLLLVLSSVLLDGGSNLSGSAT